MELQQLLYFKTAAECENISQAAQKLYISQPALTKVIQRLETDLGVQLFDRTGRAIKLNGAGRTALSYAAAILEDIEQMRMAVRASSREKDLRVLTNLPNIMRYLFPTYELEPRRTGMQSEYVETTHFKTSVLLDKACDILITNVPLADDRISNTYLLQDHLLLYVPAHHPLHEKRHVRLDELANLNFLWPNDTLNTASVRYIQRILTERHCNTTFISAADLGSMNYLLQFTDHCLITSALTSLFYTPPQRVGIPVSDPDAAISYYVAFLYEQEDVIAPLLQWIYGWFEQMEEKIRVHFPDFAAYRRST